MVLRALKKHLRLVLAFYFAVFIIIMYMWQGRSHKEMNDHQQLHKILSKYTATQKVVNENTQTGGKQADNSPIVNAQTADLSRLVIPLETINTSSVNSSFALGVAKPRQDRSLTSRLKTVFESSLDCPQKLPLHFLGMGDSYADLSLDPACPWIKSAVLNEEKNFVALGEEMAVLKNVTLNPLNFDGTKGGETINSVFNQKEDSEYFHVKNGFFSLPCTSPPHGVKFHVDRRNYRRSNHLNQWLSTLTCHNDIGVAPINEVKVSNSSVKFDVGSVNKGYIQGVTLALQRYEYANVYHTMLDWYNVFISVLILGIDPNYVTFLIVDGHPWGKLDSTWAMFGGKGVLRTGHLPRPTTFEYMVWIPNGYHCPLFNTDRQQVPFLPQLREYFFKSYGVKPNPGYDCGKLRILMIRRRDYLAHPRNPKGVLARKMANEDEIRDALITAFPQHQVRAEQLDLLSMRKQLEILSEADILVGMHGAALTYTILLPQGAALVEMYPKYAGKTSMLFKEISKWRGIHYVQWMNQDPKNEKPNKYTYIPTNIVIDLVNQVKKRMCP